MRLRVSRVVEVVAHGKLMVYVSALPVGGKANDATIALLATRLGVAKRSIRVVRGHRVRNKVVLIEGLGARVASARLRPITGPKRYE